jgi:hypothetical protein
VRRLAEVAARRAADLTFDASAGSAPLQPRRAAVGLAGDVLLVVVVAHDA